MMMKKNGYMCHSKMDESRLSDYHGTGHTHHPVTGLVYPKTFPVTRP